MSESEIQRIAEVNDSDILYSYDLSEQIEIELNSYQKGKWWMHLINGFHLMFMIFIFVEAWITLNMNCSQSYIVLIILIAISISLQIYNFIYEKSKQRRQIYKLIGLCCLAQVVFTIFFMVSLQQNVYCSNAICHPFFNGKWFLNSVDMPSEQYQTECSYIQQQFTDNKLEISQAIKDFVTIAADQYCQTNQNQNSESTDIKSNCDTLKKYQIEVEYSKIFFFGTIVMTIFEISYFLVVIFIIKKLKYLQMKRGVSQLNDQNSPDESLHYNINY